MCTPTPKMAPAKGRQVMLDICCPKCSHFTTLADLPALDMSFTYSMKWWSGERDGISSLYLPSVPSTR